MRFVDEYRAPEQVMQLVEHLQARAHLLPHTAGHPLRIMEVCGGHTHAIFKFGLRSAFCRWGESTPVSISPVARG